MRPLLLAVLCAGLAAPASAQTEAPPKFDFTIRPELYPHPVRPARDASKVMTVEEAKALSEALFAAYQNIGALARFRFHVRTKDEAPMTADELGWVEIELKDEMAAAEKLAPEAEAALKTGIERPAPDKGSRFKFGKRLRMASRARMPWSTKPTYEQYRMGEHYAMSGVMHGLYGLVDSASVRLSGEDEVKDEEKHAAELRQSLSEDYADLASSRKGMLNTAKEAENRPKDEGATADGARRRVERVTGAGPKGGRAAKGTEALRSSSVLEDRPEAGPDAAGVPDGGERITAEEAARRANAAEQRALNRKRGRSPAIVPPP
ncbi:MAG: hypothetical protein NUW21_08540 [Elusimicrobia bacterium]|nr:hypothetical protein [Elusimicrobiota bacterium]